MKIVSLIWALHFSSSISEINPIHLKIVIVNLLWQDGSNSMINTDILFSLHHVQGGGIYVFVYKAKEIINNSELSKGYCKLYISFGGNLFTTLPMVGFVLV